MTELIALFDPSTEYRFEPLAPEVTVVSAEELAAAAPVTRVPAARRDCASSSAQQGVRAPMALWVGAACFALFTLGALMYAVPRSMATEALPIESGRLVDALANKPVFPRPRVQPSASFAVREAMPVGVVRGVPLDVPEYR